MADVSAITGLVTSLQAVSEITKSLIGARDQTLIQTKIAELQAAVISAQNSALAAQANQAELLERVRQLEDEKARMEAWEAEKQRYQLNDFGGETFAYLLRPDLANGEPSHRICASCFENEKKSILQFIGRVNNSRDKYVCPGCDTDFYFGAPTEPSPRKAPTRSTWLRR